jgi:hypothetical protein
VKKIVMKQAKVAIGKKEPTKGRQRPHSTNIFQMVIRRTKP